jgi:hypothetical protein
MIELAMVLHINEDSISLEQLKCILYEGKSTRGIDFRGGLERLQELTICQITREIKSILEKVKND